MKVAFRLASRGPPALSGARAGAVTARVVVRPPSLLHAPAPPPPRWSQWGPRTGVLPCASNRRCLVTTSSVMADDQAYALCDATIDRILEHYWERTPTAVSILELIQGMEPKPASWDHFAFRSFGVDGSGVESLAPMFRAFGYEEMDELVFPVKKLRARWYSPPKRDDGGPSLPRVFVSELKVDELSEGARAVVLKYTAQGGGGVLGPLACGMGGRPWPMPTSAEYDLLAAESEYAAWTLVNGYALNHTTVAVHQLRYGGGGIAALNELLTKEGYKLNESGGVTKVSPDGGLLQSSTVADSVKVKFSDGVVRHVPGAYIEFAQRLVLPEFAHLPEGEVREEHRRDGFEAGNADKIFESTTIAMNG